jgi:hypothetical protein
MRIFLKEDDFFVMEECTNEEYETIIGAGYREVYENDSEYILQSQKQYNENLIQQNKIFLQETDYKIIKCYEAYMSNSPMPYDFEELKNSREEARQIIRNLTGDLDV